MFLVSFGIILIIAFFEQSSLLLSHLQLLPSKLFHTELVMDTADSVDTDWEVVMADTATDMVLSAVTGMALVMWSMPHRLRLRSIDQ